MNSMEIKWVQEYVIFILLLFFRERAQEWKGVGAEGEGEGQAYEDFPSGEYTVNRNLRER